eukprot:10521343-Alexandrium_andersonii.AAC.1
MPTTRLGQGKKPSTLHFSSHWDPPAAPWRASPELSREGTNARPRSATAHHRAVVQRPRWS